MAVFTTSTPEKKPVRKYRKSEKMKEKERLKAE